MTSRYVCIVTFQCDIQSNNSKLFGRKERNYLCLNTCHAMTDIVMGTVFCQQNNGDICIRMTKL